MLHFALRLERTRFIGLIRRLLISIPDHKHDPPQNSLYALSHTYLSQQVSELTRGEEKTTGREEILSVDWQVW